MITKEELQNRIGFSEPMLNRYLSKLRYLLEDSMQHGDKNKVYFNNNGVAIFDRIKQLKEQGLTLPDIEAALNKELKQGNKTGSENINQTPTQTDKTDYFLEKLFDLQQQLTQEKEQLAQEREKRYQEKQTDSERILNLETLLQTLKGELKLLPEGKTPEQIKAEWETEREKDKRRASLLTEIKKTGSLRFRKRKELIKKLEELI